MRVPTFAGLGIQVALELEQRLAPDAVARAARRGAGYAHLAERPRARSLRDAAGEADVLVGRVRRDPTRVNGILLWLALDPVRITVTAALRLAELRALPR